ncbi:MAG: MBL fold metallo-hydrolase [Clostridia bacterium]|nr:MBL fold metallo-hydrolase [Clostridia bacterium]
MFEVKHLKDNTFFYEAYTNVGVFRLNESEAVLIDACDHKRMVRGLDRELEAMGLKVKAVINTHCHVDHICGNRYFQDKYGCKLLCTEKEQFYIRYTEEEAEYYNVGLSVNKSTNPFYGAESSEAEVICAENLPEGFEIIDLPGHGFEMIGVRTPDDVVFLADSVLSVNTWENYKLPFFHSVNKAVETLGRVSQMKAALFVPSHNAPVEDIKELAEYNIEKLKEKKLLVFELCEGRGFDELFALVMEKEGLTLKTPQYCMYAVMVRNLLQALIEDDVIHTVFENNILKYYKK